MYILFLNNFKSSDSQLSYEDFDLLKKIVKTFPIVKCFLNVRLDSIPKKITQKFPFVFNKQILNFCFIDDTNLQFNDVCEFVIKTNQTNLKCFTWDIEIDSTEIEKLCATVPYRENISFFISDFTEETFEEFKNCFGDYNCLATPVSLLNCQDTTVRELLNEFGGGPFNVLTIFNYPGLKELISKYLSAKTESKIFFSSEFETQKVIQAFKNLYV